MFSFLRRATPVATALWLLLTATLGHAQPSPAPPPSAQPPPPSPPADEAPANEKPPPPDEKPATANGDDDGGDGSAPSDAPAPSNDEAPAASGRPENGDPVVNAPPGDASADETAAQMAAIAEAREHYERGRELYRDGDFKLALIEFQRANDIAPSYRILFNLGQVNMQLRNYARATESFRRYLLQGGDRISAERREAVEMELSALRSRTAYLSVDGNTPKAEVRVDGVPVGSIPLTKVLVDAGEHTVSVNFRGKSDSEYVVLAGQEHATLTIDLPIDKPTTTTIAPVIVTEDGGVSGSVVASWAVTGALTAAAIGTGVAALFAQRDLRNARAEFVETQDDLDRVANRAQALSITTDALIAASVVAAGVSIYLTVTDDDDDDDDVPDVTPPSARPALQITPGGLAFRTTF
ncbi:MAG: PEGA domain-containing protein [Myxococcota bacterium]